MRFSKKRKRSETYPFPGRERALDGHAAAYVVETLASDVLVIQRGSDSIEMTGPLGNLLSSQPGVRSRVRVAERIRTLMGLVTGYAATGLRTGAMISGTGEAREAFHAAVGKRLGCVLHLTCRALARQAGALHGSHDDYYGVANAGLFQLFARNVQEVADFALIAHRIAERSLVPGIVAQDLYDTTHSVQSVRIPDADLLDEYLGESGDMIRTPTPAQAVLFGEERRRVPVLVDHDHPAGIGSVQDQESYFRAVAASRPFFVDHLGEQIDEAMREFGELTGRHYERLVAYRTEDAAFVVIAQGAVAERLQIVVDHLRKKEKMKIGLISLCAFRPFPGPQLSRLLKGKQSVTILERGEEPLAEDLPIMREARSALNKAVENGTGKDGEVIYNQYDTYRRSSDCCRLMSGNYGVGGGLPSSAELVAVCRNMMASSPKRRFFVGATFGQPTRRFPHLQTLQQRLNRFYPHLEDFSITGTGRVEVPGPSQRVTQVVSIASQGALFATNALAQTLADVVPWNVRTMPQGGLEGGLQFASDVLLYGNKETALVAESGVADVLLVAVAGLFETVVTRTTVKQGGVVVIASNHSPESFWRGLSKRTAQWVAERNVKLFVVNAKTVTADSRSRPSFGDQLTIWALFGAWLELDLALDSSQVEGVIEGLRSRLETILGRKHYLVGDVMTAIQRGRQEATLVDYHSIHVDSRAGVEPDAPWTVSDVETGDGTVFDVTRFWHSVGYFYNTGEPDATLTDPYLATGFIPAGSSAFRDMTVLRFGIPRWLAENCTGCGLCWAYCPDSALPPTIQTMSTLVRTAIGERERVGDQLIQLSRIADQLAKQAHRLLAGDDLRQFRTMGSVLREAFSRLAAKIGLDEEKLEALGGEFESVCRVVEHLPIARTKTFFDDQESRDKGSGRMLTLGINTLSCKGCGLCVEVCPEAAFEWVGQTSDELERCRSNWAFLMTLPDVPGGVIERHLSAEDVTTLVYKLLGKRPYHSIVGGDSAPPGTGLKTAVHLVTATMEAAMGDRYDAHVRRLDSLIDGMKNKIQGQVADTVKISDFESFGRELGRIEREGLSAETLARLVGSKDRRSGETVMDPERLKRLSTLLERLERQRRSFTAGNGRARMAMAIDKSGASFWHGTYPDNPHREPWISQLPGDAPALGEGVFEGVTRRLADELATCRQAELELDDAYDPGKHDPFFRSFDWTEFTAEEHDLIPPVLVIGEMGATRWEDLSRMLASGIPVKIAIIDSTIFSVGEVVGGEHDQGAGESGRDGDLGLLALTHPGAFVLQASIGNPGHLIAGIDEGLSLGIPALFYIHAPDPQASGIAPEQIAEQASLAYRSRAFPLFRSAPLSGLVLDGNPDPNDEWTRYPLAIRDASGVESPVEMPLTVAEWAIREARFRDHFRLVGRGRLNDQTKPLPEYLDLEPGEREGLEPYIRVTDEKGQEMIAMVSRAMVEAIDQRRRRWARLRVMACAPSSPAGEQEPNVPAREASESAEQPGPAPAPNSDVYQRIVDRLLWLSGYGRDPEFFKQSLREFILGGSEKDTGE